MEAGRFDMTMRVFRDRVPYRPFTVVLLNGNRYEVDHPGALAIRDGLVMFAAPGGIPVIFDHEGVGEVIGDLSGTPVQ